MIGIVKPAIVLGEKFIRMFYEAMITAGVDQTSAMAMFSAVYAFGPRWSLLGGKRGAISYSTLSDDEQKKAFEQMNEWLADASITPNDIERRINSLRIRQKGVTGN